MPVKDFIEELRWRGLLHDSMPGTQEHLNTGPVSGYIGFDPTADSLHVGNLVQIMILTHFQRCGHKPVALVGGATGMVGDPSGKNAERNLLDEEALRHNQKCIQAQLERFLDFNAPENPARLVNNYDWFKDMGFLRFIREVGKHITVNYMMAKDSVKNRLETGLSFTEFSYQLVQGYDFHWLWKNMDCRVQMGGSDQWGNITTGTELIRRMGGGEAEQRPAFAVTTPLLTKADGSKFGKSESGNVWLDAARTSPYKYYQFWLNASDADVVKYARIFTTWEHDEIEAREAEHAAKPGTLQKLFAADITRRTHGEAELQKALKTSEAVFGNSPEALASLPESVWEDLYDTLPNPEKVENKPHPEFGIAGVSLKQIGDGIPMSKLLWWSGCTGSSGDAKRALKEGSVSVNKVKISGEDAGTTSDYLIHKRFMLLQRGKKNYFLVKVVD
ncbi:MAG: tyrosine--tRNA ligase [Flavobacteriales bacterium]|nr:MAG: tyrosine--tRNA ligase [Flavobacteriales bacterium]